MDGRRRLRGSDRALLRPGRRAPRGAGRAREQGPGGLQRLPGARSLPRLGPRAARVRLLGRRVRGGPRRRRASGSTCPSAGSPATPRATARRCSPAPPASPEFHRSTLRSHRLHERVPEHPDGVDLDTAAARTSPTTSRRATDRPLTAELIAGGRSNLTYGISDGEHQWVLRRPPLGHVLPTAHDMGREYRVLTALARHRRARPRARYALCEDTEVNGAPFYVMDRVDGHHPAASADDLSTLSAEQAAACSPGARRRARPHPRRRLRGGRAWATSAGPTGSSSASSGGGASSGSGRRPRTCPGSTSWPGGCTPRSPSRARPTIVHGDYRLDNTMLAPTDPDDDRRRARLGDVDARRPARRRRPAPPLLGPVVGAR